MPKLAFDMADTRIESIDVTDVKLYDAQRTGLALATVRGTLTQPQLGESQAKEQAYAIVLRSNGSQWKIAKVMRRVDYDNAIRIAATSGSGAGNADVVDDSDTDNPPGQGNGSGGTGPLSINPVADNYVYAFSYMNWSNTNWGGYAAARAGWHPAGGELRAYFRFDLPDLPAVAKATLRLYQYHVAGPGIADLGVHLVQSPWQEGVGIYPPTPEAGTRPGDQTWNHQPAFASAPSVQFRPPKEANQWVEVDVTDLVNAWLAGTPNYGMVITLQGRLDRSMPECVHGFRSREHEDANQRPLLVLETSGRDDPPKGGDTADTDDDNGSITHDDDSDGLTATQRAYQEYIAAYNRLTSLMAAGKGNTPEAQDAYRAYKKTKDAYEALIK